MLKAKLGMSPIAWWNDDLPQLSDDVSLEECLRQSRQAGFTGMEKGRRFPESAAEMLPILRKVALVSGVSYVIPTAESASKKARFIARRLAAVQSAGVAS